MGLWKKRYLKQGKFRAILTPGEWVCEFEIRELYHAHPGPRWEKLADGTIRFDACSNWHSRSCIHFCSTPDAILFGQLLFEIHKLSEELIENADETMWPVRTTSRINVI